MAAAKKDGFDIILSSFKSKCSDLLDSDSNFHESITAVNEHLQTESAETAGMTGEDKVAVKVITLMLPALEVLITTKQDERLNKHDVAINKLQAQVRNVFRKSHKDEIQATLLHKKQTSIKSAFTKEGRINCTLSDESKVTIDSPVDLFKIGMDNIDYKALGLPEFYGREGSPNDVSYEKESCVENKIK
ncbi:unnamed protein product [Mytilus coruscus]|uniref:Uncharacterized protein n=1 Tax=Mytilus coruscus TaxID=42192 RepID=A0A6J8E986_MYTCO|nr:unnamed protein product [Mytilus coruscus]